MISTLTLLRIRLAAERPRLLRELIGISAADLAAPSINGWSAANLLAHIADYDELFAARISAVLTGRAATLESITDLAARNEELHQRISHLPLDAAVAALDEARSQLLDAIEPLDDVTLLRRRRIPWGRVALRTWIDWRWRHDAGHARDLRRWRRTLARDFEAGPRSLLAAALEAARADLHATLRLIPAAEQTTRPICGVWTLSDLAGHLADWDSFFLGELGAITQGDTSARAGLGDGDTFNQRAAAARRDNSWEQNWHDCSTSRQQLIERVAALDDAALGLPSPPSLRTYPTAYHCCWSALEHYLDHAAGIRAALGLKLPKRLLHFAGPYA
jgi:uncharacterized damage-inducible protein DinB